MPSSIRSALHSSARSSLCTVLAGLMVSTTSLPAFASGHGNQAGPAAAAPAGGFMLLDGASSARQSLTEDEEPAEESGAEVGGQVGGNVALLRFDGDEGVGGELREYVSAALAESGYTVKGVKRSMGEAAKKNRCDSTETSCLAKVAKYLNKNSRTPFDFFVFADVATPDSGPSRVVAFDIAAGTAVVDWAPIFTSNDFVIGASLPSALAFEMTQHQSPRAALSAEEREALDNPGDPEKTPEEIAEEKRILEEAAKAAENAQRADALANVDVDLKKDFKSLCRKGPRKDRQETDIHGDLKTIRDLRPPCKRGAFFGYWQPRSWVTLMLTLGMAVGTGTIYGLTMAKRGAWNEAKDALEAAKLDGQSINPKDVAGGSASCDSEANEGCFANLAGKVSETGHEIKKMAVLGDVFLATTIVMAGVFTVMLIQDRTQAKRYLIQEKSMQVADLRITPTFGRDTRGRGQFGAAASFRF